MIRQLCLIGCLISMMLFTLSAPAYAFDFFGPACNADTANTAVCKDNTGNDPLAGSGGLIIKIADIIAFIAGGAAVIILVVSGIRFMTSGGDTEKVRSARSTLIGALIGLAVIVLARALIVFVLNHIHT
jgi:hypothetical protein